MFDQNDKEKIADLEAINAKLTRSLGRCRAILSNCREQLAANSNERELVSGNHEEGAGLAGRSDV